MEGNEKMKIALDLLDKNEVNKMINAYIERYMSDVKVENIDGEYIVINDELAGIKSVEVTVQPK
jgi:hypothetical protein